VASFTSTDPAPDILRLASQQDVDLLLLSAHVHSEGPFEGPVKEILEKAPCDVAILLGAAGGLPGNEARSVLVPFGGTDHDWGALEIGAWMARSRGLTLRLLGTAASPEGTRDASRLLANAALAVQHAAGVACEPVLAEDAPEAAIDEGAHAAAVIMGLSERWRTSGLGAPRASIASGSPSPVLAVRRGARPSGLTPDSKLTRFAWSLGRPRPAG
jgi:nucleotide-binding universal stress UspA family protein